MSYQYFSIIDRTCGSRNYRTVPSQCTPATPCGEDPKQRTHRMLSIRLHSLVTPLFNHCWGLVAVATRAAPCDTQQVLRGALGVPFLQRSLAVAAAAAAPLINGAARRHLATSYRRGAACVSIVQTTRVCRRSVPARGTNASHEFSR
jgi:hypothetical protein